MDKKLAFINCMSLQDKMNTLVNPDWKKAGNDWTLATIVEAAEFVDHLGYKWWKKQTPNVEQAFIELVDMLHFMLSQAIEYGFDSNDLEAILNESEWRGLSSKNVMSKKYIFEVLRDDLISVINYSEREFQDTFEALCTILYLARTIGYKIEDVFKMYIPKNTLNVFRQMNGYKEGTYVKIWNGKEDNEVLAELIANDDVLTYDSDLLYDKLSEVYETVEK